MLFGRGERAATKIQAIQRGRTVRKKHAAIKNVAPVAAEETVATADLQQTRNVLRPKSRPYNAAVQSKEEFKKSLSPLQLLAVEKSVADEENAASSVPSPEEERALLKSSPCSAAVACVAKWLRRSSHSNSGTYRPTLTNPRSLWKKTQHHNQWRRKASTRLQQKSKRSPWPQREKGVWTEE